MRLVLEKQERMPDHPGKRGPKPGPRNKDKPLLNCSNCGNPGYRYIYARGKNRYRYVRFIHYNEPKIPRIDKKTGRIIGSAYRRCDANGRLYSSIEEALTAAPEPVNKIKSLVVRKKRGEKRNSSSSSPRIMNCPICHHRGRVNHYKDSKQNKKIHYVIVHEPIEGTWGKERISRRRRCWIPVAGEVFATVKRRYHARRIA